MIRFETARAGLLEAVARLPQSRQPSGDSVPLWASLPTDNPTVVRRISGFQGDAYPQGMNRWQSV